MAALLSDVEASLYFRQPIKQLAEGVSRAVLSRGSRLWLRTQFKRRARSGTRQDARCAQPAPLPQEHALVTMAGK